MPVVVHLAIVAAIVWPVICRGRLMDGRTKRIVAWQYSAFSAAALFSLVVPMEWAAPVMGAGTAVFLALSSKRWANGAPEGTREQTATVIKYDWSGKNADAARTASARQ